jgi:hypothetical protein
VCRRVGIAFHFDEKERWREFILRSRWSAT